MVVAGLVVADLVAVVPVRVVRIGYTAPARILSLVRSLCRNCSPHGRFHLLSSCYRPAILLVLRIGFDSDFDFGSDTNLIHEISPFVYLFASIWRFFGVFQRYKLTFGRFCCLFFPEAFVGNGASLMADFTICRKKLLRFSGEWSQFPPRFFSGW